MNRNKLSKYLLASIFLSGVLFGCSQSPDNDEAVSDKKIKTDEGNIGDATPEAPVQKIVIRPGCIGCGLCATVDQEHFAMTEEQGVAVVISQANINSSSLKDAIKNCPPRVISLK